MVTAVQKGADNVGELISKNYSNYIIKTRNAKISLELDTTEKIMNEYWQALALCHDCTIQNNEYAAFNNCNYLYSK